MNISTINMKWHAYTLLKNEQSESRTNKQCVERRNIGKQARDDEDKNVT